MPKSIKFKIAVTSMMTMVIVVGLGRFALTPQLPHMIFEKQITLTQASLLAAANFLGYLIGSIETIRAKTHLILRLKAGLMATIIILLLSAIKPPIFLNFYINALLRLSAGFFSAWSFVIISAWVQQELKEEHGLRAMAFSGPGVGIMFSGILALELDIIHANSYCNWLIYGIAGMILLILINKNLPQKILESSDDKKFPMTLDFKILMTTYCLCGIGYVLPATFLSKLAFDQFPGSLLADAFWPLFGLAVILGMIFLGVQKINRPQRWLATIFAVQGIGILACTLLPGIVGLLIGTLLVGGAFIAILQLTMNLGAQLAPRHIRAMSGVLTTAFALGQLIGPMISALSTSLYSSIIPALLIAAMGSFIAAYLANLIKI